jgi:hypothetical protein
LIALNNGLWNERNAVVTNDHQCDQNRLCVHSTARLQLVNAGSFEKYGEVASGAFIALVGLVFLFVPVL